jgi:CBS domain-containing protein
MFRPFDLAARSLLIVGGLNWLSIAAGNVDLIAEAARRSRIGRPNIAARTVYGIIGGAALWSLARLIEQEAFPKGRRADGPSVRHAMTSNPRSVEASTSAGDVARLLRSEDLGSLPVVDGGRLVGVVTDGDLARRVMAEGRVPGDVAVGEIASRDLVTFAPDQQLEDALRLMAQRRLRRVPVVEDGRLVGMLV